MNILLIGIFLVFYCADSCFAAGASVVEGDSWCTEFTRRKPTHSVAGGAEKPWLVPEEAWDQGFIVIGLPQTFDAWKGIAWCEYDNAVKIINPLRLALGLDQLIRKKPTRKFLHTFIERRRLDRDNQYLFATLATPTKTWVVGFIKYWHARRPDNKSFTDFTVLETHGPVVQFSEYQNRGIERHLLNALALIFQSDARTAARKTIKVIGVPNNHDVMRQCLVVAGFSAIPNAYYPPLDKRSKQCQFAAYTDVIISSMA